MARSRSGGPVGWAQPQATPRSELEAHPGRPLCLDGACGQPGAHPHRAAPPSS